MFGVLVSFSSQFHCFTHPDHGQVRVLAPMRSRNLVISNDPDVVRSANPPNSTHSATIEMCFIDIFSFGELEFEHSTKTTSQANSAHPVISFRSNLHH